MLAANFEDARRRVLEQPFKYLIVHLGDDLRGRLIEVAAFQREHPLVHPILLAVPTPAADWSLLLEEVCAEIVLSTESPWFESELLATLRKLEHQLSFGPSVYLPGSARIFEVLVTSSQDKVKILDQLSGFLTELAIGGRSVRRVLDVVDELVMNAVYDAPVDAQGHALYAGVSRSTPVILRSQERAIFSYGSDGRTLALSISDPFGGLSISTFRRYIAKGLRGGNDQIDQKDGGAGLGLYLQFENVGSLCLNVQPGLRTEVVGLLDVSGSYREMSTTPKSLSCFRIGGSGLGREPE